MYHHRPSGACKIVQVLSSRPLSATQAAEVLLSYAATAPAHPHQADVGSVALALGNETQQERARALMQSVAPDIDGRMESSIKMEEETPETAVATAAEVPCNDTTDAAESSPSSAAAGDFEAPSSSAAAQLESTTPATSTKDSALSPPSDSKKERKEAKKRRKEEKRAKKEAKRAKKEKKESSPAMKQVKEED